MSYDVVFCPQELKNVLPDHVSKRFQFIVVTQLPDSRRYDANFGIVECPFQQRISQTVATLISLIENGGTGETAPHQLIPAKFYPQPEIAAWYDSLRNDPNCGRYCH